MGGSMPAGPTLADNVYTEQAKAKAQLEQNRVQTTANRPNINDPYGTEKWTQEMTAPQEVAGRWDASTGNWRWVPGYTIPGQGTDKWTKDVKLNPQGQKIFDAARVNELSQAGLEKGQIAAKQKLLPGQTALEAQNIALGTESAQAARKATSGYQATMKDAMSMAGLPAWMALDYSKLGKMPTADRATRQEAENALYSRSTSRLNPEYNKAETDLNNRLARMGFIPGSEAYNKAVEDFGRTKNDAYKGARNEAIIGGGEEQSRLLDMALKTRQQGVGEIDSTQAAANALRAGMLTERGGQRATRLSEFLQLMKAGAGGSTGSGGGGGGSGPTSGGGFKMPGSSGSSGGFDQGGVNAPDYTKANQEASKSAQERAAAQNADRMQKVQAGIAAASAAASIAGVALA